MKSRLIGAVVVPLGLLFSCPTQAALLGRLPTTPGGTDYQAYYDTTSNLTWLANANAAVGSAYDTWNPGSGSMDWTTANAWAASLNINGVTGWHLPYANPINGSTYNFSGNGYDGSSDAGYNISAPGTMYAGSNASEMAYLFYNTLGNTATCDTSGNCGALPATNAGPFSNVNAPYWSASEAGSPGDALYFNFWGGLQRVYGESWHTSAWAVHDGDVGVVPLPASVYLFASGLAGLLAFSRRSRLWA